MRYVVLAVLVFFVSPLKPVLGAEPLDLSSWFEENRVLLGRWHQVDKIEAGQVKNSLTQALSPLVGQEQKVETLSVLSRQVGAKAMPSPFLAQGVVGENYVILYPESNQYELLSSDNLANEIATVRGGIRGEFELKFESVTVESDGDVDRDDEEIEYKFALIPRVNSVKQPWAVGSQWVLATHVEDDSRDEVQASDDIIPLMIVQADKRGIVAIGSGIGDVSGDTSILIKFDPQGRLRSLSYGGISASNLKTLR